jgi:hypothetical protein
MTKDETRRLLLAIQTAYPNYRPKDNEAAVNLWTSVMDDIPLNMAMIALKSYIRTDQSGFAPSIGQLIGMIDLVEHPQTLTASEAWAMVLKAVQNGLYGCQEEFDALPADVQRAVGSAGQIRAWAFCDEEYLGTVAKGSFERTYNAITAKSEKISMLPPNLRAALEQHPEAKEPPKELPYQIEPEAFRTGVNQDNVMELLERILSK